MRGAGSIATAAGSDRVGDLKLFEPTAIHFLFAGRDGWWAAMRICQLLQRRRRFCPVTTKIARSMALTCGEESLLSIHGSRDARFACFWRRSRALLVNEDCSERAWPAGAGFRGGGDGFGVGRSQEQCLRA